MNNEAEQGLLPNSADNQRPAVETFNLTIVTDYSTVCRVCATVTEMVIPIFGGEGLKKNLADKINQHLPITVTAQDTLPLVVCYECTSTLLAAHELAECCRQADRALRTREAKRARSIKEKIEAKRAEARQEKEKAEENAPKPADVVFIAIVKSVLVNYYHTLNMDEDEECQFACQKCSWRGDTTHGLAEHLRAHRVRAVAAVARFIREHITFEQPLDGDDGAGPAPSAARPPPELPAHCCPFCESVFSAAARLALHLAEHVEISADSAVECCGSVFSDRALFVKHAQARHARAPPPGPACRACGHRADSLAALREHIRDSHADEAAARRRRTESERAAPTKDQKYIPTACPDCGKTFSNKYNMAVHARTHRERPQRFGCDRCSRVYCSRGALVTHVKVAHGGVLRFACAACGERFQTRDGRARHAAIHTGECPHACTVEGCASAFRSRNSLLRHLDAHNDRRAYKCPCGKAFRRGSHLVYHTTTHHRPAVSTRPQEACGTSDQTPGGT